jgi:multidrug resistance efflux pump
VEYLISKSVAEAPEDYEDLLRKYETDIRAHLENKHYLEIQIEKQDEDKEYLLNQLNQKESELHNLQKDLQKYQT